MGGCAALPLGGGWLNPDSKYKFNDIQYTVALTCGTLSDRPRIQLFKASRARDWIPTASKLGVVAVGFQPGPREVFVVAGK